MDRDLEEYLKLINFDSQYKRLIRKFKNKKILLYGGGKLFRLINEKYDLSKLNIIGVCDKVFNIDEEGEIYNGFKKIPPECVDKYNPDLVLTVTLEYYILINKLRNTLFKDRNIDIRPIAYVPFGMFIKEAVFGYEG